METSTSIIVFGSVFAVVYVFYKSMKRRSVLHNIPGPTSKSFLLGNMGELLQNQAGLTDFSWQETYGDVVKFKASFGIDRFFISDPKAFQHILQQAPNYRWGKFHERKEISRMATGKGILWADGDVHKRQRKIMHPGFGAPEAKRFLPVFLSCAASISRRWSDILSSEKDQSHVFNIPEWISQATLDAIGQAAFDYNFGASDNHDTELGKVYRNMMTKAFASPSNTALVALEFLQFIPTFMLEFLNNNNPSARVSTLRNVSSVANAVAKELLTAKSAALLDGKGKRDIMSLLVKANACEDPNSRLTEEEMVSQMQSLLLAGHESTSNSIAFLLYELVRNLDLQSKLRAEIRAAEKVASSRGDAELNIRDLEGMSLLSATIKETLRFHPVLLHMFRVAHEDDVLPLSTPITTKNGEVITELPMSKGSKVVLSIPAYNRHKETFGEDAHLFNPYRWLEPSHVQKGVSLGPFANLATFSGGNRSCLGWRFAVIEMQAFAVELLSNFEFNTTSKIEKIRREAALGMVLTIEGELEKGAQLPLRVSFASKGEDN